MSSVRIIEGDCRTELPKLPSEQFQCCVTSPPYYGLRDYGHEDQIGLEETPEQYIAVLVNVFREVRRVLRDDGTLWLNMGDSYANSGCGTQGKNTCRPNRAFTATGLGSRPSEGIKPKDLMGMPWTLALALRADGWYLRSDIIWSKPNPMPESVKSRPTKSHEYLFLLSKSEHYFYDHHAIKEPATNRDPGNQSHKGVTARAEGDVRHQSKAGLLDVGAVESRNAHTVWTIATVPFPQAHFATFPTKLVEPCILAGSSPYACAECNAAWLRITEEATSYESSSARAGRTADDLNSTGKHRLGGTNGNAKLKSGPVVSTKTVGWEPTCECDALLSGRCSVLDPFGGAGTVGVVADRLGRDATLIELNPEYRKMAARRLANDAGMFADVRT